jgi:hypothetical protein
MKCLLERTHERTDGRKVDVKVFANFKMASKLDCGSIASMTKLKVALGTQQAHTNAL